MTYDYNGISLNIDTDAINSYEKTFNAPVDDALIDDIVSSTFEGAGAFMMSTRDIAGIIENTLTSAVNKAKKQGGRHGI